MKVLESNDVLGNIKDPTIMEGSFYIAQKGWNYLRQGLQNWIRCYQFHNLNFEWTETLRSCYMESKEPGRN